MNGSRCLRILFQKHPVKALVSFCSCLFLQQGAIGGVLSGFRKIYVIEKSLNVKAGSADQNRKAALCGDPLDCSLRFPLKADDVPFLGRIRDVNQFMRNPLHLFFCNLGRADVHSAVNLHGIRRDHASLQAFAKLYAGSTFSACRRSCHDDHFIHSMLFSSLYDTLEFTFHFLLRKYDHGRASVRAVIGIVQ